MKQMLISILLFTAFISANGQPGVFSMSLEKAATVDTAVYKATYSLNYTCHPDVGNRFDDIRIVLIGRHTVKDFSDVICHYDSLMTADMRRGADTYSNPKGSPWPYEILLSTKEKTADMKYRLPSGLGVLHYTDSVPEFDWYFAADSTCNILGYECQLAQCDFAGRHYSAWFTAELPLPYGPYKFGGLPGLIVRLQDDEGQFVWTLTGFERSRDRIVVYDYEGERSCTATDADKTIARFFKAPNSFLLSMFGGVKGRVMIVGKDGKTRDATEVEDIPIPYKPIEIR